MRIFRAGSRIFPKKQFSATFQADFWHFLALSTHFGRSYPTIADKRQPKIVAMRVRLQAAKANVVWARTFARPTKRALRSPPMVLL